MTTVVYGRKIAMGEAYVGDVRLAVTRIELYPMTVTQQLSLDKHGYEATQVGFSPPKKHSSSKSGKHREVPHSPDLKIGDLINPSSVIKIGSVCTIQGVGKGKGFAGVVKRWNFAGGPRTHGQSDRHRAPGSIGQGTTPGRVHKGKKMAGRMGGDTVTVQGAVVVALSGNTVLVTGPVPGARHSLLRLRVIAQKDDFIPTYYSGIALQSVTPPSLDTPGTT